MRRGFGNYNYRKRRKKSSKIFIFALMPVLIISLGLFSIRAFDNKFFPSVLALAEINAKNKINEVISNSINSTIEEMELSSNDFYRKNEDEQGKINSLSVNTVLVNEFCGNVSVKIGKRLHQLEDEEISLPLGAIMGINSFANKGPKYSITILPRGNAEVDYNSSFESVGINQINFQIWITVNSRIQMVNPIRKEEVEVIRKISLVNTVINGEVPPTYFNNMLK